MEGQLMRQVKHMARNYMAFTQQLHTAATERGRMREKPIAPSRCRNRDASRRPRRSHCRHRQLTHPVAWCAKGQTREEEPVGICHKMMGSSSQTTATPNAVRGPIRGQRTRRYPRKEALLRRSARQDQGSEDCALERNGWSQLGQGKARVGRHTDSDWLNDCQPASSASLSNRQRPPAAAPSVEAVVARGGAGVNQKRCRSVRTVHDVHTVPGSTIRVTATTFDMK
ncbi:hypothetical protein LX32DRAFT_263730 [Colletotrichum zoysiae]|uniref:Uncharacterized protein n=1 Tax=Colletotrichum zoysiae TaxID=1216348 RepID=A0AAD9H2N8_9PEZI|nr:hypothetical protein LX32DRAFT_263730 [Colletotrichum zoysiae]